MKTMVRLFRDRGPRVTFWEKYGVSIGLRPGRWEAAASLGVLAFCAAFLLVQRLWGWVDESTGALPLAGGGAARFLALGALAAALWLVDLRLPEKVRRWLGLGLLLLLPLGAFFLVDHINGTNYVSFSGEKIFANYLCYLMVFALCFALTRRVWATILTGGAVFLVFGIANYFVTQFRGQPLLLWDIQAMGTAATVAGGYEYVPTGAMAMAVLWYLGAVALAVKVGPSPWKGVTRRYRIAQRGVAALVAAALFCVVFPLNMLPDMGISVWGWNQRASSDLTGITAGFFANLQEGLVEEPEGYSAEKIEALGEKLEDLPELSPLGDPEESPTIVAVMDESFTDFSAVGDVKLSTNNLSFLHSLQRRDDVIWGTAYSSVFGGNTCNSEFEFLTGNTMAFLPAGSKPYQQYIEGEQSSLAQLLGDQGYRCVAVHPGDPTAWDREEVYPLLGFDEFVDVEDFDVPRLLEHRLTSDRSTFDQLIYEYEHKEAGEPLFLFGVTIQNHGGYEDETTRTTVEVKGMEGLFPQAEQYLTLTQKSDRALEYLLSYFSQQEDPVVVLFFGDHWPNLEEEFLSQVLGTDVNALSLKNTLREYQVPFAIWANYPLEGQEIDGVSLNYLSGLLLRAAGLEGSPYLNFLEQLRGQVPVITGVGTIDKNGEQYPVGEDTPWDELLEQYEMLQYNNMFGEEERDAGLFR